MEEVFITPPLRWAVTGELYRAAIGSMTRHSGVHRQVIGQRSSSRLLLNFSASIWDSGPTPRQLSSGSRVRLLPV